MNIDAPQASALPLLRALWKEAFGDGDEFIDTFMSVAYSPQRCRCVSVDGNVAAALYWFDCSCEGQRIAYLYAIATAKAYRGRGFCKALMENTHAHLRALGYSGAVLVPASKGLFDFYGRMGYSVCSYAQELTVEATNESVDFREIDGTDFSSLRRNFLKKGSVIQENENIDFLKTQAKLFAGKDFLIAAGGKGDTLYAMELLGRLDSAAAMAGALGYSRLRARRGVHDRPFAMYLPLVDGAVTPCYFGLPFD